MSTPAEATSARVGSGTVVDDLELWIVEPRTPGVWPRLQECWKYRRLFIFFCRRNFIRVWHLSLIGWIRLVVMAGLPALATAFTFGGIGQFPSDGVPYVLFLLVGILAWNTFEFSLLLATRAMRSDARLVSRLYFPRIILIPVSTVDAMARICITIVLTLLAATYFLVTEGHWYLVLSPRLLVATGMLVVAWVFSIACGLWTAAIEGPASDVRYAIRGFCRFWFFVTPVVYPLSSVPEQWQWLIALNPMTGIVETFRWGLLGTGQLHPLSLLVSLLVLVIVGGGGLAYFSRAEARIVDRL